MSETRTQDLEGSGKSQNRKAVAGGLTIRAVLAVGFGLCVGSWLLAWSYFRGDMAALEQQSRAVSEQYMQAQEQLTLARGHIYDASIRVRDAVLNTRRFPERNLAFLERDYVLADQALVEYRPIVEGADAQQRIDQLRAELSSLRSEHLRVLDPQPADLTQAERVEMLAQITGPRRDLAIGFAEELQALNREDFVNHQATTAQLYRETQQRFSRNIGLALVASLGVALFAGIQAGRLENRLRQQRLRDIENQETLQRLSAKLLTAQEEERRSIARELHDEVGQVLTAVKVELSRARTKLAASGGEVSMLEDARTTTDHALHTVRDLSRLLHPSLLDDMGLPAALDWYIKGYRKRHNIAVEFTAAGLPDRLAPDIEVGVYRIIQEALTNIVRHAEALACSVHLRREGDRLHVTIADQGVGFDPAAVGQVKGEGLGLVNIRERVTHLSGTVSLESRPGHGTRLSLVLPVRLRARDHGVAEPDELAAAPPPRAVENLG